MTLDLYYAPASPPCRAVLLTAEAIGVTLNYKSVDLMAGEQLTPEYEQLNPQKTIPLLVDGDYKLSESRAIMAYLVDQYGNNQRLYPTNPNARALVNQRLYYDIDTLYKSATTYYVPVLLKKKCEHDPALYAKLERAFEVLEEYLNNQDYVTGRNMTIADLSLISSVTSIEAFGFEIGKYENISKWVERMKSSAPGYRAANGDGLEIFKKWINYQRSL